MSLKKDLRSQDAERQEGARGRETLRGKSSAVAFSEGSPHPKAHSAMNLSTDKPTDGYIVPRIQVPSKSPTSEHTRLGAF